MQRIAPSIGRVLAAAAVPLLIAGCSGSSGSHSSAPDSPSATTPQTASSSPSIAPAQYTRLPSPCKVLDKATVEKLTPKTKDPAGDAGKSSDTTARASCHWNGLDGFQYRWLEISYQRFESVEGIGSAETQARSSYAKLKAAQPSPEGLKKGAQPAIRLFPGLGDEAQLVSATVRKDGDDYREVSVISRASNIVVSLTYQGAGFEDDGSPKAKTIEEGAETAAKKALNAVK